MKIRILVVTIAFLCFLGCSHNDKIDKGNEVAAEIEKFKTVNNRLPNNLSEIGIKESESGPIFYQKKNETEYILWFGKELGESVTYDSQTKQWK